jgi:hypothetical protein
MSVQVNAQTASDQISHLPAEILLSLARNESGLPEFRKAAVKILIEKNYPQARHPELALIAAEIRKEKEAEGEVESIVEAAIEQPIPHANQFRASVTTKTMQTEPVVRNSQFLNDDALSGE